MQVPAVYACPAQMIGNPARLQAIRQSLEREQIAIVRLAGRSNGQRYAVHHDRITLTQAFEQPELGAAWDHVVLADDFEPIEGRIVNQNLCSMTVPQPDAEAEKFRSRMHRAGQRLSRLQGVAHGAA